jgi:ubiquinone/menaquinone biosynthesis C-methylase UbiE
VRSLDVVYREQALLRTVSEHWSGPAELIDRVARAAGTRPGDMVLDVGCGVGGPARRLAATVGCEVVALDLLEPVIARARTWTRGLPEAGVRYGVAAAEALPLRDGTVDQVWALGVVAHVRLLSAFCHEAFRVLRAGGTLALTEALGGGGERPGFAEVAPAPWRALTREELERELHRAGFAGVRTLPWPGGHPRPLDPTLAADLEAGRLVSRLVLADRP